MTTTLIITEVSPTRELSALVHSTEMVAVTDLATPTEDEEAIGNSGIRPIRGEANTTGTAPALPSGGVAGAVTTKAGEALAAAEEATSTAATMINGARTTTTAISSAEASTVVKMTIKVVVSMAISPPRATTRSMRGVVEEEIEEAPPAPEAEGVTKVSNLAGTRTPAAIHKNQSHNQTTSPSTESTAAAAGGGRARTTKAPANIT